MAELSSARVRRVRALAAVAMMAASATVGFVAGRMSAWVFPHEAARPATPVTGSIGQSSAAPPAPTEKQETAASAKTPPGTPKVGERLKRMLAKSAATSEAHAAPRPEPTAAAVPPAVASMLPAGSQAPAPEPKAPPPASSAAPAQAASQGAGAAARGVTLLNPGQGGALRAGESQPASAANPPTGDTASAKQQAAIDECERRFTSFRRSDGTYQPVGSGPRARCPLLRENVAQPARGSSGPATGSRPPAPSSFFPLW